MSADFDPAAGLAQARPDPIPAEWSPLNQALLVWCHHRVSPLWSPQDHLAARPAARTHPPPGPDQLRVSDSADTPAPAGVTFVGRCRACQASEMMISGLERKDSQCRSVLSR
jgi:hypothetical protein